MSKSKALMMAAMAMMMSSQYDYSKPEQRREVKQKPPKGAKEYFFTESSECFTIKYSDTKFVFTCYARTEAAAIK